MATAKRKAAKARVPRQSRSRETVKAIVQASEKVLAESGKAALTTARVAKVAGVSVGTLYEYFRTKEALLQAVEETSWVNQVRVVTAQVDAVDNLALDDAVHKLTYVVIDTMLQRGKLHGFTVGDGEGTRESRRAIMAEIVNVLVESLQRRAPTRLRPKDLRLALEIIVRVIPLMAWRGALDLEEHIATGRFQDEMATMVTHYLVRDAR